MAIFTRRDIQRAIDSLAGKLSCTQLERLVQRLNGKTKEALAAEWEVVALASFSRCGRVLHEPDLGGRCHPDLLFCRGESGNLEFASEIRVVSDEHTHENNPYDQFSKSIRKFMHARGRSCAGLSIDVHHINEGPLGRRKIRLTLPPRREIDRFVEIELSSFLAGIAVEPSKPAELKHDKGDIRFCLRYNPAEKQFTFGHHICYTVPYSVRNPLTNALIEKGGQLAKSGYAGTKGIVICDGGCDALRERSSAGGAFGCREIVEGYLNGHTEILWVLTLRIEERNAMLSSQRAPEIKASFYWNPKHVRSLFRDISAVLEQVVGYLPEPESTPTNAIHWLNGATGKVGLPFGGFSMQRKSIKLSARALTELLAGKIELKAFLEDHSLQPRGPGSAGPSFTFFEAQVARGNTLKNAFVESDLHKDDDWIVLEYDGPDAAISPFRVPK